MSLNFKKVSLTRDGRQLISPFSLALDANKSYAILGANGAGKSLFLELAHGLIKPSKGAVTWNAKPARRTRKSRGYVFQQRIMMRRSVADNIRFSLQARGLADEGKVEAILKRAALSEISDQPAALLSGGEAQRLALARAVVSEPKMLLMDEPTASLDPQATTAFEKILKDLKKTGTQLLWITHDRRQAKELADHIILLNQGQICEVTAAAKFFKSPKSKEAKEFLSH